MTADLPNEQPKNPQSTEMPLNDEMALSMIEKSIDEAVRTTGRGIFVIGENLIKAKKFIAHGKFEKWVADRWPQFTKRSGERYMAVFRVLGAHADTISRLDASSLYLLANESTKPEAREEIVTLCAQNEKLTPKKVREIIKSYDPPLQKSETVEVNPVDTDKIRSTIVDMIVPRITKIQRKKIIEILKGLPPEPFVNVLLRRLSELQ